VPNTTTKTIGRIKPAPAIPSPASCRPKAEAVAPATTPRGGHPGDERALPRGEGGSPHGDQHRQRAQENHHDGDQSERLGEDVAEVVHRDGGGDQHEQHPDEQLDERRLELECRRHVDAALVAEGDTHHHRCHEAGIFADQIGRDDGGDHHH